MNRRNFLEMSLAAGGAAVAGTVLRGNLERDVPHNAPLHKSGSLRDLAASKGIVFGSSVRKKQLVNDLPFAELFRQQCGILVPELELKWEALRPSPDVFDFKDADWLCDYAKSNGMLVRGHTLVWEGALPAWFGRVANERNTMQLMVEHISKVVGHFSGRLHSWDVVNEVVQIEDGRNDGLKTTPWLRFAGPEYIDMAFHSARLADPTALLVYNENFLETQDEPAERKRTAVLALLQNLLKKNVPVQALGVQAHLYAEANTTGSGFKRFLQEVNGLGLSILVTELDVRDIHLGGTFEQRDRILAKQYLNFLSFMLGFPNLKTVLTWGLTDRYTWLSRSYPRPDGFAVRPLPYDADLNPTPSLAAMVTAFQNAPRR